MKHKTFALYAFIFFFLVQFLALHAISQSTHRRASALKFFKQFQGLQKGDKLKGLHALKKHLQALGYYDQFLLDHDHDQDDHFDENLESAIKTYQINFNLKPTGVIDFKTMITMSMPRCGTPDVVKGVTGMRSGYYNVSTGSNNFHTHYALYPRNRKWPSNKPSITYAFLDPNTTQDVKEAFRNAFIRWSGFSPFAYQYLPESDYIKANIKISFQRGDHGDGFPFDGPLNILAHTFPPTDARVHFDADEKWVFEVVPGAPDMQTVALHELGHSLGLDHSSDQAAIMYPILPLGDIKDLNNDDINGIIALYGGIRH